MFRVFAGVPGVPGVSCFGTRGLRFCVRFGAQLSELAKHIPTISIIMMYDVYYTYKKESKTNGQTAHRVHIYYVATSRTAMNCMLRARMHGEGVPAR